jgi:uncharacterized protein
MTVSSSNDDLGDELAWIVESARNGNADCSFAMGLMSDAGWGVQKSEVAAAEWYLRAAKAGSAAAQYAIARMYEVGRGVEKSEKLAFEYAEMAGNQNVAPAQFMIGVFFANGTGVKRDLPSAQKWLERAMENGSRDAKSYLEMALQEGWLGKKDLRKSFAYTSELADGSNNPGAIFDLASKFSEGIGCIKNERKAFQLYQQAAELGSHEAAMMLSMVFSHGLLGQRPDPKKADHYLRLSESLLDARS